MRGWLVLITAMSAGCGDDPCCPITPADAPNLDTAIDAAAIDAPPPPKPHYVIDRMYWPQTTSQANHYSYGINLDSEGAIDNQLGMVTATLAGLGINTQLAMTRAIDTGAIIQLVDIVPGPLGLPGPVTYTIYQGTDPMPSPCASGQDTVCRNHLAGTGSFTIDPAIPKPPSLAGSIQNGSFSTGFLSAGPGQLTIRFTITDVTPITVTLIGARVRSGVIAGAISMADVDTKLIPALRNGFESQVMADCTMLQSPPTCGCQQGSQGNTLLGLFDTTPQDCSISVGEVQNDPYIGSLLAPDVTIDTVPALSLGLRVSMVSANFVAPM